MLLKGVKTDFLEPVQIFVEKKHENSVSKTPRINQRDKQRLARINVRLSVFKKFSFIPLGIEQKFWNLHIFLIWAFIETQKTTYIWPNNPKILN